MTEIRPGSGVTQITMVEPRSGKVDAVLDLMTERARFMAGQPGFVSINLHRSVDGTKLVNYIQWESRELLEAAHKSPEFRKHWPEFGDLASEIEPNLYTVAHMEA